MFTTTKNYNMTVLPANIPIGPELIADRIQKLLDFDVTSSLVDMTEFFRVCHKFYVTLPVGYLRGYNELKKKWSFLSSGLVTST